MDVPVTMPKLGSTMQSGTISRWYKDEGATVRQGEDLLTIETEKISNKLEAPRDGVLARIVAPAGADVTVGEVLAVIASAQDVPDPAARREEPATAASRS